MPAILTAFARARPPREIPQQELLDWLAEAHADAEAAQASLSDGERARFAERMRRVIARCACRPPQIERRGVSVDEVGPGSGDQAIYDLRADPHGAGTDARTRLYARRVAAYFERAYEREDDPPRDLIHVTCTGYASPSAAQRLVAARGWGATTRVVHAYHMGCYAAMPAVRLACALAESDARVDVAHTELCSLHLDPSDHALDQLVVQSLFADGYIRYSARREATEGPGLAVLAQHERVLPDSADAMTWIAGDHGMAMTLARDVPARLAAVVRDFVFELYAKAGRPRLALLDSIFAVHPGGPKILDAVRDRLELDLAQLAHSRAVLRDHGNMSSATLPHVWMRIVEDPGVTDGALIASLAFGPGLTLAGALFEKRS